VQFHNRTIYITHLKGGNGLASSSDLNLVASAWATQPITVHDICLEIEARMPPLAPLVRSAWGP
jgi:hypothetical protein